MADHLVAPALYGAMIAQPLGAAALALGVDRRLGHPWVDEDDVTRVATRGTGRVRAITAIGKNIPVYDAYDTGVFKITPALFDALGDVPAPGLSDGVRALAGQGRAIAVDCSMHDWIDIDDPRALALAERWIA
jgi:choline kinase